MYVPDDWTAKLSCAIAASLRAFNASELRSKPVVAFDVGCFPWHGSIELSVLTAEELDADPTLLEPGEIAAWPHYDFAAWLPAWEPATELGRQMADAYRTADEVGRPASVEAYLRACAAAAASPLVQQALGELRRDHRFRVSVAHPDDGRQFWPPT